MDNPNLHIENFLDYYFSFSQKLGYAVLLKGKWGTGKTWFVKQSLKKLKDSKTTYLYVSLYGMTSFEEIENAFFQQLYSLFSSESMAFAGIICKDQLKTTLKMALDGNGIRNENMVSQTPNIKLSGSLANASEFILVFDDLERTPINLENLLGYINYYVEHQGYKVVILANEDEIIEKQKDNPSSSLSYKRIKEKLIGKTFEVTPDLDNALVSFIENVESHFVQSLYQSNIDIISELYHQSLYHNLRHLKQALWDFERLANALSKEALKNNELLQQLLKIFLILSFEIKSGQILPADIAKIQYDYRLNHLSGLKQVPYKPETKKKPSFLTLNDKYKNVNLNDFCLDASIWADIFNKGDFDTNKIQESLKKTKYLLTTSTPNWIKLWHFMDLSDEEFERTLKSVEDDFDKMNYTEIGVVQHVVGMLLNFAEIKLYPKSKYEIFKSSLSYLEHLKENNLLLPTNNPVNHDFDNISWSGLDYHGKNNDQFKEFVKHIEQFTQEAITESYPKAGLQLLAQMKDHPDLFIRKITSTNKIDGNYHGLPIFSYINSSHFVETFFDIDANAKQTICLAFLERYHNSQFHEALKPEIPWLKEVIMHFEHKKQRSKGKLSEYQIQHYLEQYFKSALKMIEKSEAD